VQFTVRLPRVVATTCAIVVAAVAVAAFLPATASSDAQLVVCIDPATKAVIAADCGGTVVSLNQQGVAGKDGAAGAIGATGPVGPAGPAGPAIHLGKAKPALTARIEAALEIQSAAITGVNRDLRASLAVTNALAPSADPTIAALQSGVRVQGASVARLVNVLRALTKAQTQLLQGLE
jgi:hypothetical protein